MSVVTVPDQPPPRAWTIVIPFKGGTGGKSRLGTATAGIVGFRPDVRESLALAFLSDTFAAAAAVPAVASIIIVSSDPAVLTVPGITLVADPGAGLNPAVTAGIDRARDQDPGCPVAVLTGDLPSLASRDLAAALDQACRHRLALVPDRHGTGTALLTAAPGVPVIPFFGDRSCQAHLQAGHMVLPVPADSTLRADVDTPADLNQALRRGVGHHTRSTVLRLLPPGYGGRPAARDRPLPQPQPSDPPGLSHHRSGGSHPAAPLPIPARPAYRR